MKMNDKCMKMAGKTYIIIGFPAQIHTFIIHFHLMSIQIREFDPTDRLKLINFVFVISNSFSGTQINSYNVQIRIYAFNFIISCIQISANFSIRSEMSTG